MCDEVEYAAAFRDGFKGQLTDIQTLNPKPSVNIILNQSIETGKVNNTRLIRHSAEEHNAAIQLEPNLINCVDNELYNKALRATGGSILHDSGNFREGSPNCSQTVLFGSQDKEETLMPPQKTRKRIKSYLNNEYTKNKFLSIKDYKKMTA